MTQTAPRLTIVIPTVNRASLVARALDSALSQTYPDLEIVVSNNGSTDGTRTLLDRYQGSPRLRIFHRDETIPANPHGNFLLDQSRGELFLGLSDDDWLEPTFAQKVIEHYDRHPEVSFVWTGCWMHYADVAVPAKVGPEIEPGTDFLAGFLAGQRNPCWCAMVTRTEALRRVGPIPTDVICGDMFYWTKLAATGMVGCVASPLSHYVCYREQSDGIAGGAPVEKWGCEMRTWADDMVAACLATSSNGFSQGVRQDADALVARSTANQLVWQALRGTARKDLIRAIGSVLTLLRRGDSGIWPRVVASVLVPRPILRRGLLAKARAMASGPMD